MSPRLWPAPGLRGGGLVSRFLLALGVFGVSGLTGYLSDGTLSREVLVPLAEALAPLKGLGPVELAVLIFLNNFLKAFAVILSGLSFGIGPLLFLVGNGIILGVVAREVALQEGLGRVALGLLPHGAIELPAVLLAAALGFGVAREVFLKMGGKPSHVKGELARSLALLAVVISPALLVAALLEVLVTPLLLGGT